MTSGLKGALKIAFNKAVKPLGYTRSADTIFACELAPGVLGCIGYLTWEEVWLSVKPFVGVQFERVERIYDDVVGPLRVGPKSTPRYFPSLFLNLYDLQEEQSRYPDFRSKERDYLRITPDTISDVTDRILTDVRLYGTPYIGFNATLTNAAVTMAEGRGGGIGTVAYRLPIIYWILGRVEEAQAYMASIATRNYPIGPYEKYIALLTDRMNAGTPRPSLH